MEEIAWIIRTRNVNRQVGFTKEDGADGAEERETELEIVPSE